ncbi:tetraacyldisaccharide 4'-kinase [Maribellus maritimus]|uniref:tetraacyldisaccharide 4'-kinase n=1 Tax=Maribellus maritimus TaxID=2870838 RepID=UPI001EEB55E5|nr:tetraacyldisaccharide 4'-kinase [Maribellus maritimus]MCG6187483.1 tetraacyldisaccharide 4'-kinase [Maribellus maritimus]
MLKILLYPFSLLYGIIVYIRNRMYDLNIFKSTEFDVPVISIGNITVGGTGKTPHVEYIVNLLKEKFEIATLSRGYKRKTRGFVKVETDSPVVNVGDEPLQIKKKFPEITVSVCENRVTGVEKILEPKNEKTPDVVILDDAFQHRRITPGINILLIDYNRQIKEDMLLPAGRLREGSYQMRRANIIIFTKCPNEITPIVRRIMQKEVRLKPYQELFFTTLVYDKIIPVFSGPDLDEHFFEKKEYAVLVVTGIASPVLIYKYLGKYTSSLDTLTFPDHHHYSENDLRLIFRKFEKINSTRKIIVTTEKDAMHFKDISNLTVEFKEALYYLPVKIKFLDEEGRLFNKKILGYVGENKSNRELHKRKNSG